MKTVFLLMMLISLGGCASYKCGEFPEGRCESVSQVYENLNKGTESQDSSVENTKTSDTDKIANAKENYVQIPKLEDKTPLLTKPKILKVLINRWTDNDGDLNSGGYVFIKVEDSKWMLQ